DEGMSAIVAHSWLKNPLEPGLSREADLDRQLATESSMRGDFESQILKGRVSRRTHAVDHHALSQASLPCRRASIHNSDNAGSPLFRRVTPDNATKDSQQAAGSLAARQDEPSFPGGYLFPGRCPADVASQGKQRQLAIRLGRMKVASPQGWSEADAPGLNVAS